MPNARLNRFQSLPRWVGCRSTTVGAIVNALQPGSKSKIMRPDSENLDLTAEERKLEQSLASLQPAKSGLDRAAIFGDQDQAPAASPARQSTYRRRWIAAGIAGLIAASVLLAIFARLWFATPVDGPQPGPGQLAIDPASPQTGPPGPAYVQLACAQIRPIGAAQYEILSPRHIRLVSGELFVHVQQAEQPLVVETPAGTATAQQSHAYIQTRSSDAGRIQPGIAQPPAGDSSQNSKPSQSTSESGVRPMSTMRALTAVLVLGGMVELANPLGSIRGGPGELITAEEESAPDKALPKTAIARLKPIIAQAIKDKAYPEAIKAIGQKIALEGRIQGDKPEEKIVRMQAEIAAAPKEMKPLMEAILAHWYWQYFNANRWRFMRRTATAEPPGEDILTWDLRRIMAEIDSHFSAALAAEKELQKIPIGQYDSLLAKGNVPDSYRPTLYDFVAFDAISYYSAGEQVGARTEDAFDLLAESPIFADLNGFLAWDKITVDNNSPTAKAVRLYQDLLRFHKDDDDRSACLDADLGRLVFGYNSAFGEEKNARYKAALRRFVNQNGDHEISARAYFHWANIFQAETDFVEAHRLATLGKNAFPDSFGGKMCHNLIQRIEAPSSNVSIEYVWNDPWPSTLR